MTDAGPLPETAPAPGDRAAPRPTTRPCPRPTPPSCAPGWGDRELDLPPHPIADWAAARRARLAEQFPGERLVIPAGGFKVRANDTDYRFRADTAHTYLCGNQTSDAVLVIEDGEAVLYARPRSARATPTSSSATGSTASCGPAAGRRSSEISDSLGLEVRHIDELPSALSGTGKTRVLRGVDARVDALVAADERPRPRLRPRRSPSCGWSRTSGRSASSRRPATSPRSASRTPSASGTACSSTASAGSRAPSSAGPARWATTSATTRSSAAASTPRRCTGSTTPARSRPGELVLLDMGVEGHNLYTADVTRTLPVDGTLHRRCSATSTTSCYAAQQAGIDAVRPGVAVPRRRTTPR